MGGLIGHCMSPPTMERDGRAWIAATVTNGPGPVHDFLRTARNYTIHSITRAFSEMFHFVCRLSRRDDVIVDAGTPLHRRAAVERRADRKFGGADMRSRATERQHPVDAERQRHFTAGQ